MILIAAAAILGAALGLFMRSRLLALAIAISVSGASHLMLGFLVHVTKGKPGHEALVGNVQLITFSDVHGVWPVMASAGTGTLLAAVIWSVVQRQSTDNFWFLSSETDRRNGVRSLRFVEDRAVHEEARRKLNDILDR